MDKTEVFSGTKLDKLKLIVFHEKLFFEEYIIEDSAVLGRKSKTPTADILIDAPIVSRQHGRIFKHDNCYFYQDLDSTNGAYVNGVLYGVNSEIHQKTCILEYGDVIRIGLDQNANPDASAVVMIVTNCDDNKYVYKTINYGINSEIKIGRSATFKDDSVSVEHASFRNDGGNRYVVDKNSTNGVFVNNIRIDGSAPLNNYDVVRIATYNFVILGNQIYCYCDAKVEKSLVINIKERSVWNMFKKHKLLEDINLSIPNGSMVMILGGSGAGKTTFVNAVMGYEKAEGQINYDNMDVYKSYDRMKSTIGFVPQQDLLRLEDTVYNTLENAAEMKLPHYSPQARQMRISTVIESLGLHREVQSLVKKLSGGQRKRLSIAVELISNPSLFFLDEPDSGLDGIMAKSLMQQLRKIADEGKIVMVITHAPDRVFDLFDKVIVLAKSEQDNIGHLAFYGSPTKALQFFETDSLEGVVKRINRKDEGGDGLSDHYIAKYANENKR